MSPLQDGWEDTAFGTAERLTHRPDGEFYSHQYNQAGYDDVIAAATDFIERVTEGPTRVLALALLKYEGAETDLYQRQSNTRWRIDATLMVGMAREFMAVVLGPSAETEI